MVNKNNSLPNIDPKDIPPMPKRIYKTVEENLSENLMTLTAHSQVMSQMMFTLSQTLVYLRREIDAEAIRAVAAEHAPKSAQIKAIEAKIETYEAELKKLKGE